MPVVKFSLCLDLDQKIQYFKIPFYGKPDRISVVFLTGPTTSDLSHRPPSFSTENGAIVTAVEPLTS